MKGKFVIAEPCHEDWNSMTPEQKGRFCDVCSKCVVDFTEKKPEEILEIYNEQVGNVCGRFRKSQVEVLSGNAESGSSGLREPVRAESGALRRLQIFAAALLMVFSFGLFGKSQAQTGGKLKGNVTNMPENNKLTVNVTFGDEKAPEGIEVRLLNEDREVVQTTRVSEDGIAVFNELDAGKYYAYARGMGYESQHRLVFIRHDQHLDLPMEEELFDLGGVAYVPDNVRETEIMEELEPMEELIPKLPEEEEEEPIRDEIRSYPKMKELIEYVWYEPVKAEKEKMEKEEVHVVQVMGYVVHVEDRLEDVTPEPVRFEAPERKILTVEVAPISKLTVSPNPTVDRIEFTLKPIGGKGRLILADSNGRIYWSRYYGGDRPLEDELDLSSYTAGIYFLSWRTESEEISRRIVKIR